MLIIIVNERIYLLLLNWDLLYGFVKWIVLWICSWELWYVLIFLNVSKIR